MSKAAEGTANHKILTLVKKYTVQFVCQRVPRTVFCEMCLKFMVGTSKIVFTAVAVVSSFFTITLFGAFGLGTLGVLDANLNSL